MPMQTEQGARKETHRTIIIRPISDTDSLEHLTDLLHRAYKRLGDMGLRFFATHQTVEQTKERVVSGECFVAEMDGNVVGTICLYTKPGKESPDFYRRDDVGWFGQFGVEPELQGDGIGGKLLAYVEERAKALGLTELALDTAETATHLIDYYGSRGWRHVGYADWDVTNYRSVLLSKAI